MKLALMLHILFFVCSANQLYRKYGLLNKKNQELYLSHQWKIRRRGLTEDDQEHNWKQLNQGKQSGMLINYWSSMGSPDTNYKYDDYGNDYRHSSGGVGPFPSVMNHWDDQFAHLGYNAHEGQGFGHDSRFSNGAGTNVPYGYNSGCGGGVLYAHGETYTPVEHDGGFDLGTLYRPVSDVVMHSNTTTVP